MTDETVVGYFAVSHEDFFRADSGYFGAPLLSFFEDLGHRYLVKVKLKNLKKLLISQDWQPVVHQPGWECCEFQHCSGLQYDTVDGHAQRESTTDEMGAGKYSLLHDRVAGQLMTGGRQLIIGSDKNLLYKTEWDAWLAEGDCV